MNMKLVNRIGIIALIMSLFACANDVEINADFEETTTVFGLLDIDQDTQFVKITRTFLDDNQSAIELAQQSDRLYYDTLDVIITESESNKEIQLNKIFLPKDEGLFTTDDNQAYFTDEPLQEDRTYTLKITKPNGEVTSGETTPTEGVTLLRPSVGRLGTINFISNQSGQLQNYKFEFTTKTNVGLFEAKFRFYYIEILRNDTTLKNVEYSIGTFTNTSLDRGQDFELEYTAEKFFAGIEAAIPAEVQDSIRRVIPDNAFQVEINAADAEYTLYKDVNGPIDGLSQNRPDYTNLVNGIGLFASRHKSITVVPMPTSSDTENYIISEYGSKTNNLSKYRGFKRP